MAATVTVNNAGRTAIANVGWVFCIGRGEQFSNKRRDLWAKPELS